MDERVVQFRIGVMVLATLIITGILLTMFGGQRTVLRWFQPKQTFYVQFPEASEVTPETPVLKSGIRIGRVTRVQLADEITDVDLDPSVGVVITIEIDQDRKIFSNEVCRIKRNLLGDAVLEFVRARPVAGEPAPPKPEARETLESGAWLRGQVQTDPIQMVGNLEKDVTEAIQSVAATSNEIRGFVERIGMFLGTQEDLEPKRQRLDAILDRTLLTMESLETLTRHANDVVGDEDFKRQLRETIAETPGVMQEAQDTLGRIRASLDGMDQTIRLVNDNLQNIREFTQPLGERGGVVVSRLDRSAARLEQVMDEMYVFGQALNNPQGTVGQLLHNPELYDNLNQAVANVEDLTEQLRPVVRDARVFSDKIARHPELLGVRGAIQRNPGTKGVPSLSELQRTSYYSEPSEYAPARTR